MKTLPEKPGAFLLTYSTEQEKSCFNTAQFPADLAPLKMIYANHQE